MKFISLAVAVAGEDGDVESLYALGDDGQIYLKMVKRTSPPGVREATWAEWWERLDLPIGDPTAKVVHPQCANCGHAKLHTEYGCTWSDHDGEYDSSTDRCNCKKLVLKKEQTIIIDGHTVSVGSVIAAMKHYQLAEQEACKN